MPSRYIDIAAADGGRFTAYLSGPPAGAAPGLVVIQEIFGVNPFLREIAEHYASLGFRTIVPDLFWRQEPGVEITDRSEAEWQQAFALYQGFDEAKGVDDLSATVAALRARDDCTGQVGCVGFCLGGKLAYLMATRTDIDAAVGYYGVGIEGALDEATNISKPLMLHVAEEDQFCPKEAQQQLAEGLGGHDHVTLHSYPGMDHAFARTGGEHYDADAATLASDRALDFLKASLA